MCFSKYNREIIPKTNNQKRRKMVIEKIRREDLANMKVGESKDFAAADHMNVRSMSSQYGLAWGQKFQTRIDRNMGIIKVTRIK